jgi:hypothetical protein
LAYAPGRQLLGVVAGKNTGTAEGQDVTPSRPDDGERLEDVNGE